MAKRATIPHYKRIETELLDKINTGYYKVNDMIPTEHELSQMYQVSRVTVRKATDQLVAQGLLRRTPGSGTFVESRSAAQKVSSQISFSEEMRSLGMSTHTVVKTFTIKEADPQIATILGIDEHDMVYYIERMRYANDDVLMYEESYLAAKKFPDITIRYLEQSKYEYVEKVRGLKIDYAIHQTTPVLPPEHIAEMFHIALNTPIIKVGNTSFLTNGEVMDYTLQYMNSPKYQLNYIRKR